MARGVTEVVGIERAEQGISGDAQVEAVDQVHEELLPAHSVEQRLHGEERIRILCGDRNR